MASGALCAQGLSIASPAVTSSSSISSGAAAPRPAAAAFVKLSSSSSLWGTSGKLPIGNNGVAVATQKKAVNAVALFQSDEFEETEEEITAAYEAIYGKAFGASSPKKSWETSEVVDKDAEADEAAGKGRRGSRASDSDRSE
jgi:hypothetical protein